MQYNPNRSHRNIASLIARHPHVVGITALVLVGVVAFGVAFTYFKSQDAAPAAVVVQKPPQSNPFDGISLEAKSVYVQDLATGKVLFQRNADQQLPMASLTKVALALVVAEVESPDTVITIPYDTAPPGSAERLAQGEQWHIRDVLSFTLTASSNEGADILAAAADSDVRAKYPQATGSSATIWRMNDLVHSLGLNDMYFLNDNGLDLDVAAGKSGAYGTAREVAALFAYAASTTPETFSGTTQDGLLLTSVDGSKASAYNTNEALGAIPGLVMGKTGFTDLAGGNLGVIFDVGLSHPVVAVVMGSSQEGRFTDMKRIVTAVRKAVAQE